MRARSSRRIHQAAALSAVAALALTGCAAEGGEDAVTTTPVAATPTLDAPAGFAPDTPPPPAGTFTPAPGSWDGVDLPADYRVVLLTTDADARTRTLSAAVRSWAASEGVDLEEVDADDTTAYVDRIQESIDLGTDLVVSTGDGLVDPLALVTASNLDQQFLVVGAQLAEPTLNVTAADWDGASFRGEGLGQHSTFDPATFTPERAGRAVRAGVAAVLTGYSGTIVHVR